MSELKEQLEKTVNFLKYKIKNFDKDRLLTEEGNEEYNRLIVQKAVVAQKLKLHKNKRIHSLIEKILRKLSGKTLICDRF